MPDWYDHGGWPAQSGSGDSASARAELDAIEAAFAKLPALTGNATKLVRVNAGATALEAASAATLTLETYDQAQKGTHTNITPTGTDTITAVASPTLTAYTTGTFFKMLAAGANTGAVTLNIDSIGARAVVRPDGAPLVANDIPAANYPCLLMVRASDIVLLNPFRLFMNPSIADAKGDLIVATTADTVTRLAVGANDTFLIADSAQAEGVKWAGGATAQTALGGTTTGKSLFTAADAAAARSALAAAGTGVVNTFTTEQIVQLADDGSSPGPYLMLDRVSTSPAANDYLARLGFYGRDSAAIYTEYAYALARILDPTNGTEDGQLLLGVQVASAPTNIVSIGPGVQVGTPTGGDKGAGTINAAIYDQGNRVHSLTTMFASAEQTITAAGSLTVAHGLGSAPSLARMYAICKTIEHNWSVSQVVEVASFASGITSSYGLSWYADSTYIYIRFGSTAATLLVHNWATGTVSPITNTNWNLIIKAWS